MLLKHIVLALIVLILLLAASTGVAARLRESKVKQIKLGISKSEVEQLLGKGYPDVSSPVCEKCPPRREQFVYPANPSLWYGRFEDTLIVCYVDGVVCDM